MWLEPEGLVMWQWVTIVVSGICTFLGFYLTFLTFNSDGRGVFLFAGFGLFFGIPFIASITKLFPRRNAAAKETVSKGSKESKSTSFVPHWFMMGALTIAGIVILAAIIIPFFR